VLTPAAVWRVINASVAMGEFPWSPTRWEVSEEVDDPGQLQARAGLYFVVELVAVEGRSRPVRIARYVGQSCAVRREARSHRAGRWISGSGSEVRFFALYAPRVQERGRESLERWFHQIFRPDVSTA